MDVNSVLNSLAARPKAPKPLNARDITEWALRHGWTLVRNRPQKKSPVTGSMHRLVCQDRSLRLEARVDHSDGRHTWVRIKGGYYKDLWISADDILGGMTS